MARLVVIKNGAPAAAHELGDSWTTIGRADGNAFQIVEASISGRHCEVRWQNDELLVRDLQSTNGTFVGDKKISETKIKANESLRLGDVVLRLENSSAPPTMFSSKSLMTSAANLTAPKPAAPTANTPAPAAEEKIEAKPAATESQSAPPKTDGAETNADSTKKFHVLFVDDSLAFLETFGQACEIFSNNAWNILTAASADRALAILQERPVDLVVVDVGMPMVDGLQLHGLINRRFPGIKTAVLTGNATPDKRADALANGAELFIEKPVTSEGIQSVFNLLNSLVAWEQREGFTGALRQVGLQDVIQMECHGRRSAILAIRNRETRGKIYIESGAIIHAVVGKLAGEKALHRLLSLKGGEFQIQPFSAPEQRTINQSWEFLLIESARQSDEEINFQNKHPGKKSDAAPEETKTIEATELPDPALGDEFVVVATYDGQWTPIDGGKK